MRSFDKYFEGYKQVEVLRENGKGKRTQYVYVGDWYGYPGGAKENRKWKIVYTLLSLVVLAAYLYAQLKPAAVGSLNQVGAISILCFIPLMFELMGFVNFLPAKARWDSRTYRYGVHRLELWGWGTEALLVIDLGVEIGVATYLKVWPYEIGIVLCYAVAVAAQSVMMACLYRHKVQLLEKGEDPVAEAMKKQSSVDAGKKPEIKWPWKRKSRIP
jgi:hypothetical protein